MNRERERERIEQQDPQPGMSWHDRQWNAGAGVAEGLTLRERLLQRARAIEAGDRVTAALLRAASDQLGAERAALAEAIVAHMDQRAADEIERLRAELRTYTGDGHTLGEHLAREAT